MKHEFLLGMFHPEKQATFSVVSLLPEIFRCNDPRSRTVFHLLFNRVLRKRFDMVNNR